MNIRELLQDKVQQAMLAAEIPAEYGPHLAPSKKAGFGDYQANGAMAAAKALKSNPRDIAQKILDNLDLEGIAGKVEIAGPGFINIHLSDTWLSSQAVEILGDKRLGMTPVESAQTVVVDYSSPNLAKEMHVGHLRSSIIGDALVRALEFQGHKVIRQNHVGDWGTQFGMLIAELEEQLEDGEAAEFALKDLESFYQQAKQHFDDSEEFANRARDYVVKLQSGDERILALWSQFKKISLQHSEEIYEQLNVTLTESNVRGESAYNDDLPKVVAELQSQGLAKEDQGAQVVFLEELADKEGNPSPVIIQKQGGGYLYATTDLAALRYRANFLLADRVLYFIDARQSLHMNQVFTLARKADFVPDSISLEHHAFGTMMGSDGKPFKTRSGGTVKLAELLDEAVERAAALIAQKDPDLSEEEKVEVAQKVGIGAVKYADLSKTRTNDYIFNWESMLSFEGNTAPYLQYAYTRIQSLFRKAGIEPAELDGTITITAEQEKALTLKLLQFSEVVDQVSREAYPHVLCNYLYDVASLFMKFYEACPILKEDVDNATRDSRLGIARVAAQTLKTGLDLLGIETMEKM
ncbi:arginine--tRNA ligase [Pseudomaricurvus alkylphenolicus]|uniref:arginine--tRNA ligase n=1 Tax=Pseudomaricurvus alkylphenolicus TaxID=1306991 RepID=UPI00141DE955|nr:arginine--tRNA ligase [Pseudomaricurvus alkylphenolicus]NIB44461.1 arginine--tRNA ligase [Pseudomaricurvus alkylphenolicus]